MRLSARLGGMGLLLLVFSLPLPGVESQRNSVRVPLRAFNLDLAVVAEPRDAPLARYYLQQAASYLPLLESYVDADFPVRRITLFLDRSIEHAYQGSDGIHLARKHILNPFPAVLYHELGHFYYHAQKLPWLAEGICSYLPLAIHQAGLMAKDVLGIDAVRATWRFGALDYGSLPAISRDYRDMAWSDYYAKSFAVQDRIAAKLGAELYRRFVQAAIGLLTGPLAEGDRAVLAALRELDGGDWSAHLAAWVW